jgi:hypothetical protein
MKPNECELQQKLTEEGLERTPDEIRGLIEDTTRLAEVVDEGCYRWFKDMTPGKILVEAWKQEISVREFMEVRDLIITIYEHTHKIKEM